VLVADPPKDLRGGVPLLGRGGLVVGEDLVDDRLERSELGSRSVPGQGLGMGLDMLKRVPDGSSRVSELAGDLSDGLTIASRPTNRSIVIHGNHVLSLRAVRRSV